MGRCGAGAWPGLRVTLPWQNIASALNRFMKCQSFTVSAKTCRLRKSLPGYYGIRGKIQLWGYGIWMGRMSQSGSLPKRQQTPSALLAQKSYTHSLIWLKPEDQDRIVYLQAEGFVINWCSTMFDDMRWCWMAINLGWLYKFTAQRFFLQKLILKSF